MTTTDEQVAGTAIEQVAPGSGAYTLVTDPARKWDLASLLEALDGTPAQPAKAEPAKAPEVLRITPELRAALRRLHEVFGSVQPSEPRKLEELEVERLTAEVTTISQVMASLGKRLKAADEAMRHHMDAVAREQGIAGPVIASGVAAGHVLAAEPGEPFEIPVEGFSDPWQQRFVKGPSVLNMGRLADLLAEGSVTRKEFLALTSEVRDLDEAKIRTAVKRSPARVLGILRAITVRKPDSASLYSPKK